MSFDNSNANLRTHEANTKSKQLKWPQKAWYAHQLQKSLIIIVILLLCFVSETCKFSNNVLVFHLQAIFVLCVCRVSWMVLGFICTQDWIIIFFLNIMTCCYCKIIMTLLHANVTFLMEDELGVKAEWYVIKKQDFYLIV